MLLRILSFLCVLQSVNSDGLCFIMYELADNNLESNLRIDVLEMTLSTALRSPNTTTWVYFDNCNLDGAQPACTDTEPLWNVYNSDGTNVTGEKSPFSQYLHWDHDLEKMVINYTSDGELNSVDPNVVTDFVKTALQDCVAEGRTSYFMGFSDHGGGHLGYGPDDHGSNGGTMSNDVSNVVLASALRAALDQVEGAPAKFDVLGFDACLMSETGSAGYYGDVAKYYLASEAMEPGEGWYFSMLNNSGTAEQLALDIIDTFVNLPQYGQVGNEKVLALLDLDLLQDFLATFDLLSAEMLNLILQDADFFTQFNRARAQAMALVAASDFISDLFQRQSRSAVDVKSLLLDLDSTCVPETQSTLRSLLDNTITAYDEMFVKFAASKGSTPVTGVAVYFPKRRIFLKNNIFEQYNITTASKPTPQWRSFLETYYSSVRPQSSGTSVCTLGATPVMADSGNVTLLMNSSFTEQDGGYLIGTVVSPLVSDGVIMYGIDLTPLLSERRRLSHWREMHLANKERRSLTKKVTRDGQSPHMHQTPQGIIRNLQSENDYFVQYFGDLDVTFSGSTMSGSVQKNKEFFALLTEDGNFEPIYVSDFGTGTYHTPVVFLPPDSPITSADLEEVYANITINEFLQQFGGQYGYVSFLGAFEDENGVIEGPFSLYTSDEGIYSEVYGRIYSEVYGYEGQIVPIVYVDVSIEGEEINVLLGGFNYTVIDWNGGRNFNISRASADVYREVLGADRFYVKIVAVNDDFFVNGKGNPLEMTFYYIDQNGHVSQTDTVVHTPGSVGTDNGGSAGTSDNAGNSGGNSDSGGSVAVGNEGGASSGMDRTTSFWTLIVGMSIFMIV